MDKKQTATTRRKLLEMAAQEMDGGGVIGSVHRQMAAAGFKDQTIKKKKRKDPPPPPPKPVPANATVYNIRQFNPAEIRRFSTILFAGGRRTGKSFAMRSIMYALRARVYDCEIFSGSYDDDHPWEKYTPIKYVHYVNASTGWPKETLEDALVRQEKRKDIARKFGVECPATMFVFEDLEFLKKPIWNDQAIRELWFNGRWKRSYALCAFQYIMEIKMAIRPMFDYAVFTFEPNVSVRERIWKQFGGIVPTFEEFNQIFMHCTENRGALVIDLRALSYKVEDAMFSYRASEMGFYHIGSQSVWDDGIDAVNRMKFESERAIVQEEMQKQGCGSRKRGKNAGPVIVNIGQPSQ